MGVDMNQNLLKHIDGLCELTLVQLDDCLVSAPLRLLRNLRISHFNNLKSSRYQINDNTKRLLNRF